MRHAPAADLFGSMVGWNLKKRLAFGVSIATTPGGRRMSGHEGEMRNLRVRRSSSIPEVEGWTLPGRPA